MHNTPALRHVHVAWLHAASFPEPDLIHGKDDSDLREKDHRHQTTQERCGRLLLVSQTEVKATVLSLFSSLLAETSSFSLCTLSNYSSYLMHRRINIEQYHRQACAYRLCLCQRETSPSCKPQWYRKAVEALWTHILACTVLICLSLIHI